MSAFPRRAPLQPAMAAEARGSRRSRLWWWVVVAFIVQCAAWGAWFKIAASAHVQDVPLATAEGR